MLAEVHSEISVLMSLFSLFLGNPLCQLKNSVSVKITQQHPSQPLSRRTEIVFHLPTNPPACPSPTGIMRFYLHFCVVLATRINLLLLSDRTLVLLCEQI